MRKKKKGRKKKEYKVKINFGPATSNVAAESHLSGSMAEGEQTLAEKLKAQRFTC